jgi:hypothetical protein
MISRLIRNLLMVALFTFTGMTAHAQLNITEYFTMSQNFKLDLDNKVVEKNIYIKGVLDIKWYARDADLIITYDPAQNDIDTVLRNVLKNTGGEVVYGNQKLNFADAENKLGQNSKNEQR